MLLFILLKVKKRKRLTKELLILLAHIQPWSMTDIFLISILVALVKLIGYAQIHIGIAFWALMAFVLIDLYIVKRIHLFDIWMLRKRIIFDEDAK
jgi:paraquat-inducible protein A